MAIHRVSHKQPRNNPQDAERGLRADNPKVGSAVYCACCDHAFTWTTDEPAIYLQPRAEGVEVGVPIAAVLCPHCYVIATRGNAGLRRISRKVMRNNSTIFGAISIVAAMLYRGSAGAK